MDETKLSAILTELKSVKALFASLERDQITLEERIAVADRSQRRIGYYFCGLFILFTASDDQVNSIASIQTNVVAVGWTGGNVQTGSAIGERDTFIAKLGSDLSGNQSTPICFTKGTRISTALGVVNVEELWIGSDALSDQNKPVGVKWIGYQCRTPEFAQFQDYLPVKISAGAVDENVPIRDLYLSPDHAVLIDEHLIHAKALVNGKTILQMTDWEGDIEYYHIETEGHEIIYAEGVPCETFIDNVSRNQFDNYAEYQALYPNTRMMKELPLPRVKFKRQLPSAIKERLEQRISELTRQKKG